MVDIVKGAGGKAGGGGATEEPNTLVTNTIAKAVYLFSEGPVEGLATEDGAQSIYFNDVPLKDASGLNNYNGVSWTFREGLPDQDVIPGMVSASTTIGVSTKVTFGTPVVRTIAGEYDAVNVTVSIPTLAFADTDSGALQGTDLSYTIEVKTSTGSYVTVHTENLVKQKTTSEWQRAYRVDLPPGGSPWSVRLTRNTADSGSVNLNNDLFWATYATLVDGKFSYRNSAVLGLSLNAKQFNNQIPTVTARIKGVKIWVPKNYDPVARTYATTGAGTSGGIWDGTFKAAFTSNPVWIYHDLLINNRYGLGQDFNPTDDPESSFIDKWSLYPIAQFCDASVTNGYGGTEPRYTVNIQITDKQEAYDLLQQIMSTVNGMIYFSAEQVVAVADMPGTISDIYTQADVIDGVFEYSGTALKTRHSAVVSYFNDPNNLFKRDSVVFEDAEMIGKIGYRSIEINNFGCTSRAQALRAARWFLYTEKKQTQSITFKTGQRGGFLTPGDLIKVFDDYKAGERRGGRVISEFAGIITLDSPQTIPSGSHLMFIDIGGVVHNSSIVGSYTNSTSITISGSAVPFAGGLYAIVTPDLDGQIFRILTIKEDENNQYTVIALQHDDSKYDIIDAVGVLGTPPTSVYGTNKLSPVTDADITHWYEYVSGTEAYPHITISWVKPNDYRISGFEVQLKTPILDYYTVQDGPQVSWDSPRLPSDDANGYSARIRTKDALGRFSVWFYILDFSVVGNEVDPDPPTNVTVTPVINGYVVNWDNTPAADFKFVEVYEGVTTTRTDSVLVAEVSDDFWIKQGLTPGNTRYVWLRTRSHAKTHNASSYAGPYTCIAKGVNIADFDDEVAGIPIVDILPDPVGYIGPPIVFLTTNQKLYTYKDGAWELTVVVVPDDFNPGIPGFASAPSVGDYTEGQTYYNTTDGMLYRLTSGAWLAVAAPSDVSSGSTNPGSGTEGDLFFNTTDGKLYRYHSGAWTSAIAATDLTGQVIASQIADGAIVASKLLVGSFDNIIANPTSEDTAGSTYALAGQFSDSGNAYAGTYVRRVVTPSTTEVDVIVTPKIACSAGDKYYFEAQGKKQSGSIDGKIGIRFYDATNTLVGSAALSSAATGSYTLLTVTGTAPSTTAWVEFYLAGFTAAGTAYFDALYARKMLTGSLIVDGTIQAAKLVANSITASQIAAGTITATEIAANTITAGKIAASTITATEIASATITAAKIAAGTITANELAANSVTAGKIAAGAVTANAIGAGTITVAINLGSSAKIVLDGVNNRIVISD